MYVLYILYKTPCVFLGGFGFGLFGDFALTVGAAVVLAPAQGIAPSQRGDPLARQAQMENFCGRLGDVDARPVSAYNKRRGH